MRCRAGSALLAVVALGFVAAGCAGSGGDKAGGPEKPLVLTLATHDGLYAHRTFAAAVSRLSGGSIRLEVHNSWRDAEPDYERGLIADVAGGKADLGIVGVRVWDTLGVTSVRAFVAPFLIDSLALQRRVLQTERASGSLDGVQRADVVGIALLPGTLRRPLGFSRPLVGPDDYRGATFGIRAGSVARASVSALGARAVAYVPGLASSLDGAELDYSTVGDSSYDQQARALTANVVLWPRIQTVVMNRTAFDGLTSEQQEILRRAGREAVAPELARIERDEDVAFSAICQRGKLAFAAASPTELAALRDAVRPVYAELERDAQTRELIAEIRSLRAAVGAVSAQARCPAPRARTESAAAELEGRWKVARATRQEMIKAGITPRNADELGRLTQGTPVMIFENGRHRGIDLDTGKTLSTGTYEVDGDIIRLVFETGAALQLGRVYELRWSVYRDSLTLSAVQGSEALILFTIKPLTRIP